MSADRVDRTRAVTTRLTKRDPTNRRSVRERLWKIWQVGFREGRNVGGPSRSDTGRHDPSSKPRPDKGEVSPRETLKNTSRAAWGRVEMSANRLDRTRVDTTRLAKCRRPHRKSSRARKIEQERTLFLPNISRLTRGLVSKESVVLHRWGRETQNFGFINWVDKVNWPL